MGNEQIRGSSKREVGRRFLSSFSLRPLDEMRDRKENYKKYYREHRDKKLAYTRQYHIKHRDERLARGKQWRETHRDEISASKKLYYEQNKDKCKQSVKAWQESHKEQYREIGRRKSSKRQRSLGFIPLNKYFEGCEAHHIDRNYVIYIPRELHQSIPHDLIRGTNMLIINALAVEYLQGERI